MLSSATAMRNIPDECNYLHCDAAAKQKATTLVTPDKTVYDEGLQPQQNMGQASSIAGDAVPSDVATGAPGCGSHFVVQPLTTSLKAVRSAAPRRSRPSLRTTDRSHSSSVQKGATLVLEVDALGFRLLKAKSLDAIRAFGWGEIHSWLHSPGRFSFRFYEEKYFQSLHMLHLFAAGCPCLHTCTDSQVHKLCTFVMKVTDNYRIQFQAATSRRTAS